METKNDDETATKNSGDEIDCIFQWKIDNLSHSWWFKKGQRLESPKFIADGLEGTKWSLWLYPMGEKKEEEEEEEEEWEWVSFYLYRDMNCNGPHTIQVKYQLSFLHEDGSFLEERTNTVIFKKGDRWGYTGFEGREIVFITDREVYLPEDTLTVQCRLWKSEEETPTKSKYLYARTVLNGSRKSFYWRIDKFSTIQPGIRKKFKNDLIEFDLVINEDSKCKKLSIDMISCNNGIKYISCNTWITDSELKKENCGIKKYYAFDFKKGALTPLMTFPTKFLENKSRYFPNDVLSLEFDIVLLTVEYPNNRKHSVKNGGQEKYENTSVIINDLNIMYNDRILSDTELRTSTKTFSAHKSILSARSPVFRKMFSHDMKENNSGHVDIDDLEDDTVHRMLLYMYTGFLDDLQLESAFKLFAAADKYEIKFIKSRCTSFLKGSLCQTTACDILNLADRHQDDDLKNTAQVYILKHDEIFQSEEWKCFMNTNLKLAADIMYMKINSGKI